MGERMKKCSKYNTKIFRSKILLILISNICTYYSCTDMNNILFEKTINNGTIKMKTIYNGYTKSECLKGCIGYPEAYYRFVFISKEHGSWITKYAIGCTEDCAGCILMYIRTREVWMDFIQMIHNTFMEETTLFISTTKDTYGVNAKEILMYLIAPIVMLKKDEVKKYLNEHPETEIMKL